MNREMCLILSPSKRLRISLRNPKHDLFYTISLLKRRITGFDLYNIHIKGASYVVHSMQYAARIDRRQNMFPILLGLDWQIQTISRWICQSNESRFWGSYFASDPITYHASRITHYVSRITHHDS